MADPVLLQVLARIESALVLLKQTIAERKDVSAALEALERTLPEEVQGAKGSRLGDCFRELSGSARQLERAEDPKAEWYAVLVEATNDALTDFEHALAHEQRKVSEQPS